MKVLSLLAVLGLFGVSAQSARAADLYLYYNSHSPSLYEIGISEAEVAKAYDDIYGPAAEELPLEVQYIDFYVAHYPDDSYVFILTAPYNCAQLGCATTVYRRDADGDLQPQEDDAVPVKCKEYTDDKLICIKGGYKPDLPEKPKPKGPIHYPAPRQK